MFKVPPCLCFILSDDRHFPMAGGAHATPTGRRGIGAGEERLPAPKGKEIRGYKRLIEWRAGGREGSEGPSMLGILRRLFASTISKG